MAMPAKSGRVSRSLEIKSNEQFKCQIRYKNAAWPGMKFHFIPHNLLVLERFCMILTNHTDHNKTALLPDKIKKIRMKIDIPTQFLTLLTQINMRPFNCPMITMCF